MREDESIIAHWFATWVRWFASIRVYWFAGIRVIVIVIVIDFAIVIVIVIVILLLRQWGVRNMGLLGGISIVIVFVIVIVIAVVCNMVYWLVSGFAGLLVSVLLLLLLLQWLATWFAGWYQGLLVCWYQGISSRITSVRHSIPSPYQQHCPTRPQETRGKDKEKEQRKKKIPKKLRIYAPTLVEPYLNINQHQPAPIRINQHQ